MAEYKETYEDDHEKIDITNIDYKFIVIESVRETMKISRTDWHNNVSQYNKLIESLNFLEAVLIPIHDDEYTQNKDLENPKIFFANIINLLNRAKFIPKKMTDII